MPRVADHLPALAGLIDFRNRTALEERCEFLLPALTGKFPSLVQRRWAPPPACSLGPWRALLSRHCERPGDGRHRRRQARQSPGIGQPARDVRPVHCEMVLDAWSRSGARCRRQTPRRLRVCRLVDGARRARSGSRAALRGTDVLSIRAGAALLRLSRAAACRCARSQDGARLQLCRALRRRHPRARSVDVLHRRQAARTGLPASLRRDRSPSGAVLAPGQVHRPGARRQ